jgi:hypothetical protein
VAVLAAAGLLGFAALGPLDLPLNDRYVLVPALALLLLGAGATGHVRRSAVAAGAAALAIVPAAVALPGDLDETREMVRLAGQKSDGDRDLARLAELPSVRAEVARCSYVVASGSGRAAVAALLERDPADVPIARRPLPRPGTAAFSTADSLPPGTSRMTREGAWAFVSRC